MKNIHRLSMILALAVSVSLPASADDPLISDQQMKEAERLFSGPSEEDYYRTDAILTSATGSAKPVFLAPSVASVITKEEIEAIGAATLDEVLETVPGLHVYISSFSLFTKKWSIRGIHTEGNPQVLLLINGQPIQNLHVGFRPAQFQLPVSMISRVEVIRGPGSAVHGADAFAGTINVITKDGQEIDGVQAGVRGGSFGRKDAWVQHGGKYGDWDLAVGFDLMRSDGDDERIIGRDTQSALDVNFGTSASLAPGPLETQYNTISTHVVMNRQHWKLHLWGWSERDGGVGAGLTEALSTNNRRSSNLLLGDIDYSNDQWFQNWTLGFRLGYLYNEEEDHLQLFPAGAVLPIGSDGNLNFTSPAGFTLFTDGFIGAPEHTFNRYSLETSALYNGLAQHNMRFALGYQYADVRYRARQNWGPGVIDGSQAVVDGSLTDLTGQPGIFMPDVDRKLWYLSAQDEWAFTHNWELTLGARYDHYSDFGGTFNPRAALVWQTRHDLTTKLLYGRAFRAPSFSNMHAQNNPIGLGNPNLDPEVIDTLELALDYRPSPDLRMAANLFVYEIDGLIEFVPDPGGASATSQNSRDQKGQGVELEIDWETTRNLRLTGNLAWQDSEDKATGDPTPDAPGLQAYANAHWKFLPRWSVDGQWIWIGDRKRAAGDTRSDIDDYSTVNLTLRRKKLFDTIDLALAVRNLFDEDIREPSTTSIPEDYPMESRSVWLEVRTAL
ncbi:MAG: TonB-dependent receptor [Candidatus Thiodiazotropha sp. (ex Monitilora ramsayi)]|nr:TonB-dependent receptor [Candidatus Thiodiazotropha sp. (ex Monitilora ramsayi)]